MRYIRLKSVTWWAGIASILTGILMMTGASQAWAELAMVISLLSGSADASPASMIVLGLGLIGIRDKLERLRE